MLSLWRLKWPFCEQGMRSIVSDSGPKLQLSAVFSVMTVSRIVHPAFEWFSLFRSAWCSACVGGIDRPWIGLRRAWLLMSVCAGSHGDSWSSSCPARPANDVGEREEAEGCCIAHWNYIYQRWLQINTPTHKLYTNDTQADCQHKLILFL